MAFASLWSTSESFHSYFESDIIDSSQLENIVSFLQVAWPYVLPPLFVIGIEAPLSLRTWMAVQNARLAPKSDEEDQIPRSSRISRCFSFMRKYALTHIAPAYLLVVTLLGTALQFLGGVEAGTMILYDAITLAPLFTYVTSRLIAFCLNIHIFSVRRDEDGDPYMVRTIRPCLPRAIVLLPVLLSLGIVCRSVLYNEDKLCTSIIHAALLLDLVGSDISSSKTFRSMAMYAITNMLTLVALVAFLSSHFGSLSLVHFTNDTAFGKNFDTAYANYHATHSTHYATYTEGGPLSNLLEILPEWFTSFIGVNSNMTYVEMDRWPLFALAVLWNVFPVELIALCYRLDYSKALTRLLEEAEIGDFVQAREELPRNQSWTWGQGWSWNGFGARSNLGLGLGLDVRGEDGTREEKVPLITHDFLSSASDNAERRGPVCLPASPTVANMTLEEWEGSHHRMNTVLSLAEKEGIDTYPSAPPPSPCCGSQESVRVQNGIIPGLTNAINTDLPGKEAAESRLPSYASLRWFIFSRPSKTRPLSACAALTYTASTIALLAVLYFFGNQRQEGNGEPYTDENAEQIIWTSIRMQYIAPLLPLLTLPIIVFVVLLRAATLRSDSEGISTTSSQSASPVGDLWRYEEMWGSPYPQENGSSSKVINLTDLESLSPSERMGLEGRGVVYCVILNEAGNEEGRKVFVDEKLSAAIA